MLAPDAPSHLECAGTIAVVSRDTYQSLVYAETDFYDYFRAVTPIDVIERMQIRISSGTPKRDGRLDGYFLCRGCLPGHKHAT